MLPSHELFHNGKAIEKSIMNGGKREEELHTDMSTTLVQLKPRYIPNSPSQHAQGTVSLQTAPQRQPPPWFLPPPDYLGR